MEHKNKKGFTLIEMIISFAILTILAGLGLAVSMDYYRTYSFNYEENLVVQILQKARSESMANINQKPHGFCFDSANYNYVIFENDPLGPKETFPASKAISVSGADCGSGDEIYFEQLSGDSSPAEITVSQNAKLEIIQINEEGRINIQ